MSPNQKIKALYVHIPFCEHLCHYCDYTKMLYHPEWATTYLRWLFLELDHYQPTSLQSIYIGGGTPTALRLDQLELLLMTLRPLIDNNYEFTVEGNIENLTLEKLKLLHHYGVNRLSIGVQSFNDRLLKKMNRNHRGKDVNTTISMAREVGFNNINIDLIFDLPGQTNRDLIADIETAIKLDVEHISTYSLTVHPHTVFGIRGVKTVSNDRSRNHYDLILDQLRKAGYRRYEVSNFAKPGYEARHNQTYWNNEFYYGVGLGASGYIKEDDDEIRYKNTQNFSKYCQGITISEREKIDLTLKEEYYLMLKLRLDTGFDEREYHRLFDAEFSVRYFDKFPKLLEGGLLHNYQHFWYATDDGLMLLDKIIVTLLS